jgi:hypothetical protein
MVKGQLSVRIADDDMDRMKALQNRYGISQAGIVAMLLRNETSRLSQSEGWEWKKHIKTLGGR